MNISVSLFCLFNNVVSNTFPESKTKQEKTACLVIRMFLEMFMNRWDSCSPCILKSIKMYLVENHCSNMSEPSLGLKQYGFMSPGIFTLQQKNQGLVSTVFFILVLCAVLNSAILATMLMLLAADCFVFEI